MNDRFYDNTPKVNGELPRVEQLKQLAECFQSGWRLAEAGGRVTATVAGEVFPEANQVNLREWLLAGAEFFLTGYENVNRGVEQFMLMKDRGLR